MNKRSYRPNGDRPYVRSLSELLTMTSERWGSRPVYLYKRGRDDCEMTYSQFGRLSFAVAAALDAMLPRGAHAAIIGEKCVEWLSVYFGAVVSGNVVVPLDRELDPTQIRGFADFADCDCVFYTSKFKDVFERHEAELPKAMRFIEITLDAPASLDALSDTPPEGSHISFRELVAYGLARLRSGDYIPPDAEARSDLSAIIFTSGTTGTSKGVMLTEKGIVSCFVNAIAYLDIDENDVLVSVLPFHHTYEISAGILAAMLCGCTIALNDSVTSALRDFKYYRPTTLVLVPLFVSTICRRIIDTTRKQGMTQRLNGALLISGGLRRVGIDLRGRLFSQITSNFGGRLKKIVCGGAPLAPELVMKFDDFGINLTQGYGITECSPILAVLPFQIKKPHSCGLLLESVQAFINRTDPEDETGEIVVKADNVMLGYYKNEEATAAVLTSRGWFYTGDCGYIEDDFLYITGRKKNVIIASNGKNVYPEELEEYLESIPHILECAVVGNTDEETGDVKITAVIYPDAEALEAESVTEREAFFRERINALNRTLPNYKQIRTIILRDEPFPKTTTKKIKRQEIRI